MGTVFAQGAQWVRADFHLHTRADREFKYTGDDNFYNSNYVDALEKAGIHLAVITNHNKFDFEEFKALRKTAQKKDIALLPGVELSVNDGANGIHTWLFFPTTGWPMAMTILTPSWALRLKEKFLPSTSRKTGVPLCRYWKPSRSWKAIIATFSLSLPMSKHRAGCGPNWTGTSCRAGPERILPPPHAGLPEGTHVQQAAREEQTLPDQNAAASRGLVPRRTGRLRRQMHRGHRSGQSLLPQIGRAVL